MFFLDTKLILDKFIDDYIKFQIFLNNFLYLSLRYGNARKRIYTTASNRGRNIVGSASGYRGEGKRGGRKTGAKQKHICLQAATVKG